MLQNKLVDNPVKFFYPQTARNVFRRAAALAEDFANRAGFIAAFNVVIFRHRIKNYSVIKDRSPSTIALNR